MHFNHYGRDAVALAVDLANRPPTDPDELVARCDAAGFVFDSDDIGLNDLRNTVDYLEHWRDVARATDEQTRADLLNELLVRHAAAPRLTNHAGSGWHLHFRDDDVAGWQQICVLISAATALHLTGRGIDRMGACELDECTHVFADTSRNGRQRYCSPACANRAAVRRHRAGHTRAGRGGHTTTR